MKSKMRMLKTSAELSLLAVIPRLARACGIPLVLAKLSAIALTGFVGFRLSDYVKRRTETANLDHKF